MIGRQLLSDRSNLTHRPDLNHVKLLLYTFKFKLQYNILYKYSRFVRFVNVQTSDSSWLCQEAAQERRGIYALPCKISYICISNEQYTNICLHQDNLTYSYTTAWPTDLQKSVTMWTHGFEWCPFQGSSSRWSHSLSLQVKSSWSYRIPILNLYYTAWTYSHKNGFKMISFYWEKIIRYYGSLNIVFLYTQ